jgi:hypothetical protein
MCSAKANVRFGPKADTASLARSARIAVPAMKLEQELDKPSSVVIIARLEGDFNHLPSKCLFVISTDDPVELEPSTIQNAATVS